MRGKRRSFGPPFKAKVALAAIRGDKTTALRRSLRRAQAVSRIAAIWEQLAYYRPNALPLPDVLWPWYSTVTVSSGFWEDTWTRRCRTLSAG